MEITFAMNVLTVLDLMKKPVNVFHVNSLSVLNANSNKADLIVRNVWSGTL